MFGWHGHRLIGTKENSIKWKRQLSGVELHFNQGFPKQIQNAMTEPSHERRQFLFVAHPGHELCVHGWLETARPRVFVLTDGSGRSGRSRIQSTTKILKQAGAEPGSIYGRLTDAEIYRAILNHDFELFLSITEEFAKALVLDEVELVAGDAIEGFNPAHDVCRLIINAAVEFVRRSWAQAIANRDFLLVGRHDTYPSELRERAVWLELSDYAFQRKLEVARDFDELRSEIGAALDGDLQSLRNYPELSQNLGLRYNSLGLEAYRFECLRPVEEKPGCDDFADQPPFYERFGELRVAERDYQSVIRYREHIQPIAAALREFVEQGSRIKMLENAATI